MITLKQFYEKAGVKAPCLEVTENVNIILRNGYGELVEPRPDQYQGLNKCLTENRFGLFDDPGVGKTVVAQAYAIHKVLTGKKVLVLMPPILLYQFDESLCETFEGIENHLTRHILDDSPAERALLEEGWKEHGYPDILSATPQMFYKYWNVLREQYTVLVADEVHKYLTQAEAGIYKRIAAFLGGWEDSECVLMTGTPLGNELTQAYGLTKLLNPGAYFDYKTFEREHCVYKTIMLKEPKRLKNGKLQTSMRILNGYKNVVKLEKSLYRRARRVIKEDVLSLETPAIDVIPVQLYPEHLRLYQELSKKRVLELDEGEVFTTLQDQALRQAILQLVSSPQKYVGKGVKVRNIIVEATKDFIVEAGDSKVIVFANYLETAATLTEALAEYNPAVLNGSVNDKQKQRDKFLSDDSCRVLIAHPNSAGVGLNLQSVSNYVIFAEPCSVPGDFKQAFERVYRGGQLNKVTVKILKALHTGAVKSVENMFRKADDIQMVNRDRVSMMSYING